MGSHAIRAPRILILTLSFGSGHVRAAEALSQELRQSASRVEVEVVDVLAGSRLWFRAGYVWPYWWMLRYARGLWRRLFSRRLRRGTRHTAPAWAFRHGCSRVFDSIRTFQPDVIVAAEVGACEIAVIARRLEITPASIVNLITDHHAEPAWVHPEVSEFAVADEEVARQLQQWGASAHQITVCGIPADPRFSEDIDVQDTRVRYGAHDNLPLVLLMGGGMGPTRMDRVAAHLCATGQPMHVVAVSGHDHRAWRRLSRIRGHADASIRVEGWSDDIPSLMRSADVLVTKPGGLTTTEAALCGVPTVLFDPIPGPEERNAARFVAAGAGVTVSGDEATASAVTALLADEWTRAAMATHARALARPAARHDVAALTLRVCRRAICDDDRPVVILSIRNGGGHISSAKATAAAIVQEAPATRVAVLDVADYMTWVARATHVSIYLWLVRHAPFLWAYIDRYQKRQPRTSPEWYYRHGCTRLFRLVRSLRPRTLIATEVGCSEIAALLKRDLFPECALVAINDVYDTDRALVREDVDVYCAPTPEVADQLCAWGADRARVFVWGVPVAPEFRPAGSRPAAREEARRRLAVDSNTPMILVGGGSEGLGRLDLVAARLLRLPEPLQVVVLVGRNRRLKRRCDVLARSRGNRRLRVVEWTAGVADWMHAADFFVTKPGHAVDEAIANGLPMICLPPLPGSEEAQSRLVDTWNVGRAVRDPEELAEVVTRLLSHPHEVRAMLDAARSRSHQDAARAVALWVRATLEPSSSSAAGWMS